MADTAQPTRRTAAGTVKLAASQAAMVVGGVAIHVYLARALEPKFYGDLAVVTSVINWWQVVSFSLLGAATIRFVAAAGNKWGEVAATAVRTQLLWSISLLVLYVASASTIARLLGDPSLTPLLWLFGVDLIFYGLYQAYRRVLMGRRKYGTAAITWGWYWVAKVLLVCGLVALGLSVKGAIIGSVGASVVGLILAWWWNGVRTPEEWFSARTLIMFGLPLTGLAVLGRVFEYMDLWCVKALLASAQAPGYYWAAKNMYSAAMTVPAAVMVAMLPTLTQAIATKNQAACRELIEQAFRFVFVTMLGALALVSCGAKEVITLVFSAPYAAAATPATILMVAGVMVSVRGVGSTTLVAAHKPGLCFAALAPVLPVNIGLNLLLVPRYELIGAAIATATTGLLSAAIMTVLMWREFRMLFSVRSLLRVTLVAAAVYLLGRLIPAAGGLIVVKLLGLVGAYLLLLTLTGELTRRDLALVMFWRS